MKKEAIAESVAPVETPVHPMLKQRFLVSTKTVDYNKLTAFEATSMAAVFVLSVVVGTLQSTLA